jgi:bis(5'-nucleosyl)-tetraphosphatase (symmetrical)
LSRSSTHYVIGDIHGHAEVLRRLLERCGFDPDRDRLWLVGDLVNRGPDSPGTLRLACDLDRRMGDRFAAVLGNHDAHLLALAEGLASLRGRDTVEDVLEAPDREELLTWLGGLPLLHLEGDRLLVHAGLMPEWTPEEAERRARRVEDRLRDPEGRRLLLPRELEATAGETADPSLEELRRDFQVFIRLRTLTRNGELCDYSGPLDEVPDGCVPWFRIPRRCSAGVEVYFGHWAALGLHRRPRIAALDTGCAWNGCLTALRLDDGAVFQEGCAG